MATEVKNVQAKSPVPQQAAGEAPSIEIAMPGHLFRRAWFCPLVKRVCLDISEPPGPEACSDCAIYKTWHTADHVDQRFWY
ncbi:MAG: hypothetical protein PVH68_15680 [Armatimonadota bacterium]|jgi:hypothetical protein